MLPSAAFWPGRRASFTFPCPANSAPAPLPREFTYAGHSSASIHQTVLRLIVPLARFKGTAAFSFPSKAFLGLFRRERKKRERERERGRGREGPRSRCLFRGNSRRLGSVTKPTIGARLSRVSCRRRTNPSYNTYQKFPADSFVSST